MYPIPRSPLRRPQAGFNIIELMMVVVIIGLLAAIAIPAYRDNTMRANMSEVLLGLSPCRLAVTEGWSKEMVSPGAGNWGCETSTAASKFIGKVQTTVQGEIRIELANLHPDYNGLHVYMKPYDVSPPPATGGGVFTGIQVVRHWKCGVADSDTASHALLNFLPSSCRDTIDMAGTWAPA